MYKPGIVNASSLDALAGSARAEFGRLAIEFSQPSDYLSLKTLHAEPARIFDGMMVKADGTDWNPGSGAGIYARIGSSWIKAGGSGGGGGATNLSYTASPTSGLVASDTGTDATLPLVDGTNAGLMAPAQYSKLSGIAPGAQVNPANTDALSEGSTNQYFTASRVRSTVLTGLSTAAGTIVTATHTILEAIGFLQKQSSDNSTALSGKQATLISGANIKTINSNSLLGSGDLAITAVAFPVGAVFIAVVSTNPATLLGYGTWSEFGAGRVLVGFNSADSDFNTVEGTGGNKTSAISAHSGAAVANHASHTHTYTDVPNHTHPHNMQGGTTAATTGTNVMGSTATGGSSRAMAIATSNPTGGVATGTTAGPSATLTHSVTQPSNHTDLSVVQPYITVYMWKRTA